jgi:hypothetical protein
MLLLANEDLAVDLIDPGNEAEFGRLGARFCWGGYIWRVRDLKAGDLLAGPEWPREDPRPFNGQGAPESFRHAAWPTQRPLTLVDGRGFIPGVGDVASGSDGGPVVERPCRWEISSGDRLLEFQTRQAALGWECELVRTVSLTGRTLTSASRLANRGNRPLPLHWFAHPFFALDSGVLTCDLPSGYGCEENPGFAMDPSGRLTFKRPFAGVDDGHFQLLKIAPATPLKATLSHPNLEFVRFATDFVPDLCPVWGNGNTWSIEPYIMTTLTPGESRTWSLKYEFGPTR